MSRRNPSPFAALFLLACPLLMGQALHIDAGSASDQYFTGGWSYAYPGAPSSLPTMRYGNFSYAIPLAPGGYTVTLTFVERVVNAAGAHVFSVTANGALVLPALDIFAEAGVNQALTKSFPVTVGTAPLSLVFATITRNASVNLIDIAPVVASGGTNAALVYVSPIVPSSAQDNTYTIPGASHRLLGMACRSIQVQLYEVLPDGKSGDLQAGHTVDPITCDVRIYFAVPQTNFYAVLTGLGI